MPDHRYLVFPIIFMLTVTIHAALTPRLRYSQFIKTSPIRRYDVQQSYAPATISSIAWW